jgi:hypothetical protein
MLNRKTALLLMASLLSCSAPQREPKPLESSPYTLDIQIVWDIDTSLVDRFNKYVVDESVPRVTQFRLGKSFPQIFPSIVLLSATYERRPEAMLLCYDTLSGRFFQIVDRSFEIDFNEVIGDRFEDGINEEQAFWIAASAMFMKYHPKLIVSRPADIFLEPRLRDYISETYTPEPGRPGKEFSNLWWGWSAFPSANSEYRKLYEAYKDSIAGNEFLQDIPEGTFTLPTVEKDGIYYIVTFFSIPAAIEGEVHRHRLSIASDGKLHRESSEVVFYY